MATPSVTPRVRLKVLSARGIGSTPGAPAADTLEPYCQASCGAVTLRTAVKQGSTEPAWNQDFTFGVKKPLGDAVSFKVFSNSARGQDVFLGEATLPIATLEPDTTTQHTLALRVNDNADETCGELLLEATYEPTFSRSTLSPKAAQATAPSTEGKASPAPKSSLSPPVDSSPGSVPPTALAEPTTGPARTSVVPGAPLETTSDDKKPEATAPPNFYVITILEGKDLKAMDGSGDDATSDPLVKLHCTKNQSQSTKTLQQTLNPKWRQRFFFSVTLSEAQVLELIVEDSDMLSNDFIGRCLINLERFKKSFNGAKQVFWVGLEDQPKSEDNGLFSDLSPNRSLDYGCGQICIAIEMQFIDRKVTTPEQGEVDRVTVVPSSRGLCDEHNKLCDDEPDSKGTDSTEHKAHHTGEAAGTSDDIDLEQPETEEELKQHEAENEKLLSMLSDIQFQSGEYQIQVRIIEVRDLHPMDINGLCDPVVAVDCLGQRQYTSVKKKQLSCMLDESLFFSFKDLDKETVAQGSIKVSVIDADAFRFGLTGGYGEQLIGFFAMDIPYVYFRPGHELKRKWVALVGSGQSNSDSIQGYVKLSVAVVGPGDKMKVLSDERDEDPDEVSVKSKKDINSLVLVPPRVTQTLSYLVVSIHRAEDLPNMDQGMLTQGGIDGFVRAYFSGQDVLETKRVTVKGSEFLAVEFNQELWFPVLLPTMSDNIFISVWDSDITTNELVANIMQPFSFRQVKASPKQFENRWTNLYGPPIGYVVDSSSCRRMQNQPAHASMYRGRLLVSLRVEDASKSSNDRPHARTIVHPSLGPPTTRFTLRVALFYGTEIPMFASKTNWNRNTSMSVRISIGKHAIESSNADNVSGVCQWNQYLEIPDITLPSDIAQVPDVFVHLVRLQMTEARYICYARYTAKEIFDAVARTGDLSTIPPPKWITLTKDSVFNDLKERDFTGNLLMNMRLEKAQQAESAKDANLAHQWRQHANKSLVYMKYTLFVHVFQGRCLPAGDVNGLADPYVQASCGGVDGKVATRMATRDPCYYETIVLDIELPQDQQFLPKLSLQVYDEDRFHADDFIGGIKFTLTDFPKLSSSKYAEKLANKTYAAPLPQWYPIFFEKEGDSEGELLLSFDLIQKDSPSAVVEPPPSIHPPTEDVFVEVTCLGCRGLQSTGFMPLASPLAKFEIGEISKLNQPKFTNPSSKPSPKNPNFLQRVLIPVKMPVDALFAPRLNVTVSDQLLGGFYKPVLGVCSIDLSRKLRFSNGKPNPMFIDRLNSDTSQSGSNPYVDQAKDLSSFPGTVPAAVARSLSSMTSSDQGNLAIERKEHKRDSGLGVFPSGTSSSMDWYDDDDVPHYMVNRGNVEGVLEDDLDAAFETYALFRGDMLVRRDASREPVLNAYRPVGRFKGVVRILKSRDEPPVFNLDQFLNPQTYLVRVYIIDATNLVPRDDNNKCDPYLQVTLGDGRKVEHVFNDRKNYKKETVAPRFHTMFQFKADLPGASELRVDLFDYDSLSLSNITRGLTSSEDSNGDPTSSGDDYIGGTMIDLEDRWFSSKWQTLGLGCSDHPQESRKPLETRPLYAPSSSLPRGSVRLWVDILSGPEIHSIKPLDISPPPPEHFEVRVIIYKAKNVLSGDFTDLSDLFIKCWLQTHDEKAQTTDTHWRAKRGKASFNWRMKFDIVLPTDPEIEADKGYLHLQLWDKDVLYDDCLADTVVDLTAFLKEAYKTKQVVNVFGKPKPVRIRGTSSLPLSPRHRAGYSSTEQAASGASQQGGAVPECVVDIDDDRGGVSRPLLGSTPSDNGTIEAATSHSDTDDEDEDEDELENAQSLVKSFMTRFGMGDDPEDSSWLTLTTRDTSTGERLRAGNLLVSVEILPVAVAKARAAGLGRSEPNNFPFLPEPADRLHLSAMWNPLYVLEAMMGPKYYRTFASFVVCALFVLLVIFAGPLINVLLTLLELVPWPYGFIAFGVVFVLAVAAIAYWTYKCRRAIVRATANASSSSRRGKRSM